MSISLTSGYDQIKDENGKQRKPATSSDVTFPSSISLYVLRYANPNENWNIQAFFPDDVKFNFMVDRMLIHQEINDSKKEQSPLLYQLQLHMRLDDNGQLSILHENQWHELDTYRIRISEKFGLTCHFEDSVTRRLIYDPSMSHQFIFDLHFEKNIMSLSPPGSGVPFWDHLCIFTYFIINMKVFEAFNSFLEQFSDALKDRNRGFSHENLKMFFQLCQKYYLSIETIVKNDLMALKTLIRMISCLPINAENMTIGIQAAEYFASTVLEILSEKFDFILSTVDENEWPSFREGLLTLCCIQLHCQKPKEGTIDPIVLLSMMPEDGTRRGETAIDFLNLLLKLRFTLPVNRKTDLIKLVGQEQLTLEHLELAASFETYISYLTQFIICHQQEDNQLTDSITNNFEKHLHESRLPMEFVDIAFILKYLKSETEENHDDPSVAATRQIQKILENNYTLRNTVENHLNLKNHHVLLNDFPAVHDIIFQYNDSYIVFGINRQQFLLRTLNRRNDHTIDYFIDWFKYFLCESQPLWMNYKELLEQWTQCFLHDRDMFKKIITQIDMLTELWTKVTLNDEKRLSFFVTHMVTRCFQQGRIYNLIKDGLNAARNASFIEAFKNKFYNDQLITNTSRLKEIYNQENPLLQLINIDKQQEGQNKLVKDLIDLSMSFIKMDDQELIEDTFRHPARETFTYALLFDPSPNSLSIRQQILDRLLKHLEKWEEGVRASDIYIWRNFSEEQARIFGRIWTLVAQSTGKQYQLDRIFSLSDEEMKKKLEINQKVMTCIDTYCQQAGDKNMYMELLQKIHQHLEQEYVQSVQTMPALTAIIPFAEKLNPYVKTISWQTFLDRKSKRPEVSPEEIQFVFVNMTSETTKPTCLDILQQTVQFLEEFHNIVRRIAADHRKLPIGEIFWLFPDIRQAENDLQSLQPLLEPRALSQLLSIVSFWKNHSRTQHICLGLMNLSTKIPATIDSSLLKKVLDINADTLGATCVLILQQYREQIEKRLSDKILTFISYYSSSSVLIEFLHSITADDVYNLQEAANDWDETVVNTITIFDFSVVKTFIDRVYAEIEAEHKKLKNTPLLLEHIINCIENIWKDNQFVNLLKCLESSSLALSSIKYVHLELIDKEQAKRLRISDILQKSTVSFIRIDRHETIFDTDVTFSTQQTSTTGEMKQQKITLSDLNELRDRVRLLEYSSNVNHRNVSRIESEHDKIKLNYFIQFSNIIESTLKTLTTLYISGYPSISEFIAPVKTFSCIDGIFNELSDNNTVLKNLLNTWRDRLCSMYEVYNDLTYFTGNQFWLIENYIYNPSSLSHPGYHLLRYIDIDPSSIDQLPKQPQKAEERLENLGHLLNEQRRRFPPQQGCHNIKKCLFVKTTNQGMLRAILSLFSKTKTPAKVHYLFFCTPNTNWVQVQAFIYRCFYSQVFHQLIHPELLSQSIQDRFIRLLRSLIEKKTNHNFQMVIIASDTSTNQQLINGIQAMDMLNILRDEELLHKDELKENIKQLIRSYTLVTSRITGLGKSTFIRQAIRQSNKDYVKFSLYGDFTNDTLAKRLRTKFSQLQTGALHLDIGPTDNSQQLNKILYCLLLFGSFRFEQEAVSIPLNTPVYIELDASPESTLNEVTLFQHLQSSEHLKCVDWTNLNVDSVEIQGVANYLQAVANQTIIRQDITPAMLERLDATTCSRLIQETFLKNKNVEYITWTQLSIFVAVFYRLFTDFSLCPYFLVAYVPRSGLRMDLVNTLLQSSQQFTSVSVENIRQQQRSVSDNQSTEFSDAIVRWDKTEPFTMVFTATNDPLFVYKKSTYVPLALREYLRLYYQRTRLARRITDNQMFPDYNNLTHEDFFIKLASLSQKYFNKSICPKCFRQYEYIQQNCQRCSTKYLLIRPTSFDPKDITNFQQLIAKQLQNDYVLTPDNFIKMLLIYMRVQSGVPVLIMGETGCGKTSLIQFLCEKILDDELQVFRMHAGVGAEKIIEKMQQYIRQAEECKDQKKRLWIFYDEFNTTTNIGVLKEIICERTLLGEPLPANIVFLGACNPRRQKTNRSIINDDAHIGLRKSRYETMKTLSAGTDRRLLYTVVPIPETMLEYIWDYGYLNQTTEQAYISTMLNTCRNLSCNSTIYNLILNLLIESQNHFREIEDVSSVSLRDIARFCRLYNWFYDSLLERERQHDSMRDPLHFLFRASSIALLLCYYFRLRSGPLKKIYINKIQSIIIRYFPSYSRNPDYWIKNILKFEQDELIDKKMELPLGTASNRALRDNIFVLLACIINRIPLFLCGKPGSSKSSAVQIVISNLKGKKSKDAYFQTLPELVAVSFQGSQNCTSESIIKVFERAANYSRVKSQSELLPVIVFDEIGLAELSPHNPLKVLHAELEIENNQYGFVGISNWRLDASKMNRALYLSTPDPTVKDLQLTGTIIAESIQKQIEGEYIPLEPIIIESLSQAYRVLYENMKETDPNYENYFGLRDYYCLIKGIVRDLMNVKDKAKIAEIIRRQLKVNFDGFLDGSVLLWQTFCEHIKKPHLFHKYAGPSFNILLDQALSSRSGRYLMLIADNEGMIDYVERFINTHQQKQNIGVRTLVGSSFPGDLLSGNTYCEQYNNRVLMDIILYAETNVTLIMRQMGHLYDSLYDLFNQNFSVFARKKYCRIALGAVYHPRCLINDDFYCVVFIHKQDLDKCDPPFLNRFEKHLIDTQALIHPKYWSVSRDLQIWLENLLPKNTGKHFPLLQHLFVDYSPDHICNLVIDAFEQLDISVDEEQTDDKIKTIMDYCQAKLIRTSSFELPIVLALESTPENQALIGHYYDAHFSVTFAKLIEESFEKLDFSPRIIYTYTQIFHTIDNLPNIVEEITLCTFRTELELTNKIKRHYQASTSTRLLLIRVDYHVEHQHILSLKHVVLNERMAANDRGVWLVFHLQRNLLNQITNDISFNGWSAGMIDDLNDRNIIPRNILESPSYRDLVFLPQFASFEMFDDLVDRCLSKFRYIISQKTDQGKINSRRNMLFEQIVDRKKSSTLEDFHLRSIIQENVKRLIQDNIASDNTRFTDWRHDLLTNSTTIAASRSIHDALQSIVSIFHNAYLTLLLTHLEKHAFIDAYVFIASVSDENIQKYLSKLWIECLKSTLENIDSTTMNHELIEIPLVFNLKLPCAAAEYKNIQCIRDKLQQLQDNNKFPDNFDFPLEQLRTSKVYNDTFMELVFSNHQIFQFYFHDQIAMHLIETKIQLSPEFVFELITSNPFRSLKQHRRLFLVEHMELTEILHLFEISLQLISEEEILTLVRNQLSIDPTDEIRSSTFYTLVLHNQQFYQLPPKTTLIEDKWTSKCKGDPMIDTSLMNLIELILSPSVINRASNIQQITTVFSLIATGIRDLPSFWVNNLEKLRSYLSLIRCLTTLIPNQALDVFKTVCEAGFDAKFDSCTSIHQFIGYIHEIVKKERQSTSTNDTIQRTLVKLEIEFLNDWLVDNSDSYGEILALMNDPGNNLWHYSAKIFSIIDRKLDLLTTLQENNGKLSLSEDHEQFNETLALINNRTRNVERLLVNRLHMHLMMSTHGDEIDQQLTEHFTHFEDNLREMQNIKNLANGHLVFLLAWLKYYAQMYAFALNNDSRENVMIKIDQLLTNMDTPFCSTLKLFITKQLLQMSKQSLNELRDVYVNRIVLWIHPFLLRPRDQQAKNELRHIIPPTPLFEYQPDFQQVSRILNQVNKNDELRRLIHDCGTTHKLCYAFLCWFIHYYCRFTLPNVQIDGVFIQLIEHDLSQDLIHAFTPLGHRFLVSLCSNFSQESYFRLNPDMELNDIHMRLLALNITAIFISFKSLPAITLLGSILFDAQRQVPPSIIQHMSTICLPGLTISDPVITQMMDVRTQIQEGLKQNKIRNEGKFIFQCSNECPWMFYFQDCGVPNDQNICPLCKNCIGAELYNVLIERNPPQIRMPIDEGLQKIDEYIDQHNRTARFGYHNIKAAETSTLGEKPDHLNRPISFRFIHFLMHGLLVFLHDRGYLADNELEQRWKLSTSTHFRDHFEKDYDLLVETSTDRQQCYIWLYKLLNHLVGSDFAKQGVMNTNETVVQIEQLIEQKLIFAHIDSVDNEITEYKTAYAKFIQERDAEPTLEDFAEELFEDENRYPLLNFFNVTKFHTSNLLDEFILKMQTLPFGEQTYPVTSFLLKRFDEYSNIQYLYPIVAFTNYLIEKFNHRIKRHDAAEKKIQHYLTTSNDQQTIQQLYNDFLPAWYALKNLKEVRYGCQTPKFELTVPKERFSENTSIAMLLLNTSRDESSLLLAACLKTLAELQNQIVNYFHNAVEHVVGTEIKQKHVPLQSIRPEHILHLDQNILSEKLVNDSLVLNYQYGKSKHIIYDFEEIEITLRNMISSLVLIDTDKLHFLNYQFELYGENSSLINDVRARIKQERLPNNERMKLESFFVTMKNDDILNYLGSLDYIFTYLINSIIENATENTTIQAFVEYHVHYNACLNDTVLLGPPFSTIQLRYIISLYEMLEEIAFDHVLRAYVKKELAEETFTVEEQNSVLDRFSRATYEKEKIANTLKSIDCWISMLKRLMIRVLNANVSLDVPLQLYLERTDLWSDPVTDVDLATFELEDNILLQHTYVILLGLENKKQQTNNGEKSQQAKRVIPSVEKQRQIAQTWFKTTIKPRNRETDNRKPR